MMKGSIRNAVEQIPFVWLTAYILYLKEALGYNLGAAWATSWVPDWMESIEIFKNAYPI